MSDHIESNSDRAVRLANEALLKHANKTMGHASTPWDYENYEGIFHVRNKDGMVLFSVSRHLILDERKVLNDNIYEPEKLHEVIELIVRAVNSHEALLEVLILARKQLDSDWGIGRSPISKEIDKAIAQAEGKP